MVFWPASWPGHYRHKCHNLHCPGRRMVSDQHQPWNCERFVTRGTRWRDGNTALSHSRLVLSSPSTNWRCGCCRSCCRCCLCCCWCRRIIYIWLVFFYRICRRCRCWCRCYCCCWHLCEKHLCHTAGYLRLGVNCPVYLSCGFEKLLTIGR